MRDYVLLTLMLSLFLGCSPAEPAAPVVDLAAEREALMQADRAWAEAYTASEHPAEAFVNQMVADAYFLPPDAPLARGVEAIREIVTGLEAMPGFTITWGPSDAAVGGGDLGYTIGSYQMSMDGAEGRAIRIDGKYLTVWRKQEDGSWRVVADMFNANGPPTPLGE